MFCNLLVSNRFNMSSGMLCDSFDRPFWHLMIPLQPVNRSYRDLLPLIYSIVMCVFLINMFCHFKYILTAGFYAAIIIHSNVMFFLYNRQGYILLVNLNVQFVVLLIIISVIYLPIRNVERYFSGFDWWILTEFGRFLFVEMLWNSFVNWLLKFAVDY